MTDHCSTDYPWTGETPDAETEPDARTGVECATIETYSQACETPAKAGDVAHLLGGATGPPGPLG